MFRVDLARACPDAKEVNRSEAIECNFFAAFQRQGVVFIAQHNDGFLGSFTCHNRMSFQVGLVGEFVALEMRGLDNVLQHPTHIAVKFLLVDGALVDGSQKAVNLYLSARFHQVVARFCGFHRSVFDPPVGHHDAVEAPLVAEDCGQQVVFLLGVFAVKLVVRRHHRPRFPFLDGNLEIFKIEFPQCTVAYARIVFQAVNLLVVGREMFDRSANTVLLYTAHVSRSHLAREQRVFGIVLEVAATKRVAVEVHSRGEEHIHAIFQHFVAHRSGHCFDEFRVP